MVITYAAEASGIRPYQLPGDVLLDMGRIIRACAEIEDVVSLYLGRLAALSEGHIVVLLGRTAISQRLKMLEIFSDAHGAEAVAMFRECFDTDSFKGMLKCRNAVAHGVLLGLTDEDRIAFRVAELIGADTVSASLGVLSYTTEDIKNFAKLATAGLHYLEDRLKLKALREKRRQQPLDPHRKANRQGRQGAKPSPPPTA